MVRQIQRLLFRSRFRFCTLASIGIHFVVILWMFHRLVEVEGPKPPVFLALEEEAEVYTTHESPKMEERPFATTEKAEKEARPKKSELLSNLSQTVEKETRAPSAEAFRSSEPGVPGDHSPIGMSDLGVSPQHPIGEHGTSPTWEGFNELHSTTDEYLPDLDLGPRTLLSAREYAHWGFIDRIKSQVSSPWRRSIDKRVGALLLMGQVLRKEESTTKIHVEMNSEGEVKDVFIISSSGSEMLDSAAVEAFKRAGPFPNPPKQLIRKNGGIAIRWTFVVTQARVGQVFANEVPVRRTRNL